MSRSTHKRGVSGGASTVATTLLRFNLIGICSLHNPDSGKRIGDEPRVESGVYQTHAFECHVEAVAIGSLGSKEAGIAISVLISITS